MSDQEEIISQKKRFLKRYKNNIACIKRLKNKIRILDERITNIKSPNYSGMPRGGIPISIDDLMSDKLELEERVERLKRKNVKVKKEILDAIDSLDDPRLCEVLESFFVDCIPLEDIAEADGYTLRHIYRLYSEAVSKISLN